MTLSALKPHSLKFFLLAFAANLSLVACLLLGEAKPWEEIDWIDVFGEGGGAVMVLAWLLMIVGSRPAGRVTNLLFLGLGLVFLALWQDNLDEFIRLPNPQWWDMWLESVPLPIGMAFITWGMILWQREQRVITDQLKKREGSFREHTQVDPVTQLASASYLEKQIEIGIESSEETQPLSLLMVDIDGFDSINREYGVREGDRLLQAIGELIVLNIRRTDLVCRYSGDRFAVLLPNTGKLMASTLAQEIRSSVSHLAHKVVRGGETLTVTVSIGVALAPTASAADLINVANNNLAAVKSGLIKEPAA